MILLLLIISRQMADDQDFIIKHQFSFEVKRWPSVPNIVPKGVFYCGLVDYKI